jgi:flagellar M-ring protein FliF
VAIRSEEKATEKNSEQNTKADGQGKIITNSHETAVTNYEINKTIQHVVSQVGNIQRLWVAVLVDGSYKEVAAGAGGKKESSRQYVPRSQEELDKISGIVKSAVGFVVERNDIIEIANVAFETNQIVEDEGVSIFNNIDTDYWLDVMFKILLLVAGVMILLKMRKAYSNFMKKQRVIMDRRMAEDEARRQREEAMPKLKNEPQLVDHFRTIAKEKPAEVAKVVKTMMIEE